MQNSYRSDECFAKETVYSCSFVRPLPEPRKKPIVHKDHITMAGEIQTETEQQLSYKVKCVPVVKKIIPKNHNLGSKGHMIFKTTMRDDYNLPCFREREQQIIPKENLCIYSCPMESKTTTGCSYTPICANPVENYKPDENYTSPEGTMDLNTIQRTSYRQVDLPKKEETPWAIKLEYCKPKTELNATTVYNNSYKKPGYYVNMEDCNYQID
ncbi:Hypothetical protein CINCED_3A011758 [Cinara cedri]|uniref:Uncharacterized protein n=1 Tax=Cinara cedri TaxID=506608 RepID=A0A5E4NR91_9HEMI|nr:Hypothetical protein CINCED_3A011758 [Cinara cedri]